MSKKNDYIFKNNKKILRQCTIYYQKKVKRSEVERSPNFNSYYKEKIN